MARSWWFRPSESVTNGWYVWVTASILLDALIRLVG